MYTHYFINAKKLMETLASTNQKIGGNVTNSFKVLLLVNRGGFEIWFQLLLTLVFIFHFLTMSRMLENQAWWKVKVCVCMLSCFSYVQLFATLWTVAWQASLSMGFSRQEFWSRLHDLFQGIFPTHSCL